MLVVDRSVTWASTFTALKNGLPVLGLKSACNAKPRLLTLIRSEESSSAGSVEPIRLDIDVAADVESGSSVMKVISPSVTVSLPLFT